jgi:hypothetical protein
MAAYSFLATTGRLAGIIKMGMAHNGGLRADPVCYVKLVQISEDRQMELQIKAWFKRNVFIFTI